MDGECFLIKASVEANERRAGSLNQEQLSKRHLPEESWQRALLEDKLRTR